jgi:hypothetical protein
VARKSGILVRGAQAASLHRQWPTLQNWFETLFYTMISKQMSLITRDDVVKIILRRVSETKARSVTVRKVFKLLSFPVRNGNGVTGKLSCGNKLRDGFLDGSRCECLL